jgi:type II secretory pathway pseudopilin PulG
MTTLRNERGAVIVLYAIAMVAMLGMAALAVDLGMLRKAKAEAQRAADAAALAAASAYADDFDATTTISTAFSRGIAIAEQNYMNGLAFDGTTGGVYTGNNYTSAEVTIDLMPDDLPPKARVKVRRAAVPTWFAQIFGINTLPVGAVAAAEADWASGTKCVKPIALPDLWDDVDDDPDGNKVPSIGESWMYEAGDIYIPAHYGGVDGAGTGLGSELRNMAPAPYDQGALPSPGIRDWGRQVVIKPSVNGSAQPCVGDLQGNKCYVPSWWGWWGGTPKTMESMILGCDDVVRSVGDVIEYESGWKNSVLQAMDIVYNRDPGAHWDEGVTDDLTGKPGTVAGSDLGDHWRASDRVWIVAMISPGEVPPAPSDKDIIFNNFMLFFFEGCMNDDFTGPITGDCASPGKMVLGRFLGTAQGTETGGPNPGSMVRILRLVE